LILFLSGGLRLRGCWREKSIIYAGICSLKIGKFKIFFTAFRTRNQAEKAYQNKTNLQC
jgi:hypothetical protein